MKEVICRKCGKIFCPAPQHIYKDNKGMYCSWTCYNHRDEKTNQRKYKYVECYDKDGSLLRRFKSSTAAAQFTGFEIKKIADACRKGTEYHGFLWKYKE